MAKQTRLMRRGGRWYVNAKVPKDLQPILGKSLIRYSLKTADHREALERVRLESAKIDAQFAEARRRANGGPVTRMTETEVEQLALLWFARRNRAVEDAETCNALQRDRREVLEEAGQNIAMLSDPDEPGTRAAVQAETKRLMDENHVAFDRSCREYRLLSELIRRGFLEMTQQGRDRLNGDYSGQAHDARFARAAPGAEAPQNGERVSQVFERWFAENERRWAASTRAEFRTAVRMFMETAGDVPIRELRRADVREFKDLLLKAPVRLSGTYKGITLPKAVEQSAGDPKVRRLAPGTVNKYLTALGSMFRWAQNNGFMDENPASGLKVALGKRPDQARKPFSAEDLKAIFGAPIFQVGHWPSKRAERYWLPLLGAYTGCRLEELAQLHVYDIRQRDGIWVISINDEGAKSLKSLSSRREVPIHSALIDKGFLRYVEEAKGQGHTRLFPDLKRGARGSYGQSFSKWFSRWRRQLSINAADKGYHSFRHGYAQALRDAGVDQELRDTLLGHAHHRTGARYGSGYGVRALKRAIEKIEYNPASNISQF